MTTMSVTLLSRLWLAFDGGDATAVPQFSRSLAMERANALGATATVFQIGSGGSISLVVEGSNDQQNWMGLGEILVLGAVGSSEAQLGNITTSYIRLSATLSASEEASTALLAVVIDRQQL